MISQDTGNYLYAPPMEQIFYFILFILLFLHSLTCVYIVWATFPWAEALLRKHKR
jgi:hypothetical protein